VRPGRGQSRSGGLERIERVVVAASVIAEWGPKRRPQADGEGNHSWREVGEWAWWGANGKVGSAMAQEGLAVRLEPWT
jgi:hypothetical protein